MSGGRTPIPGVVAAMVSVAVAFGSVIGFGFWIHAETDRISDDAFGLAAGLAIPVIATGVYCLLTGIRPRIPWPGGRRAVRSGPTELQIAYRADPSMTVCCAHLREVERGIREAGIETHLLDVQGFAPRVWAKCRIHEGKLRAEYALPEFVSYTEAYSPERDEFDNPHALLLCGKCGDRCGGMTLLHPDHCDRKTRWFPK